ncbi:hypothetical protein ABIB44_000554 [Hymenobacter sp. UYCo722]
MRSFLQSKAPGPYGAWRFAFANYQTLLAHKLAPAQQLAGRPKQAQVV